MPAKTNWLTLRSLQNVIQNLRRIFQQQKQENILVNKQMNLHGQ